MALIFVTNHHPDERTWAVSNHAYGDKEATEREKSYTREWVGRHIVGEPRATEAYTVEQLKAMGLVGLYKESTENVMANDFDTYELAPEDERDLLDQYTTDQVENRESLRRLADNAVDNPGTLTVEQIEDIKTDAGIYESGYEPVPMDF